MQNAHINSYSDKATSPAIPFGGSARHFAASAANTTNYYIQFTLPFTLRTISIILHSTISAIVTDLVLLCLPARCLSVLSRAFFVVASGSHPMLVIPANATVTRATAVTSPICPISLPDEVGVLPLSTRISTPIRFRWIGQVKAFRWRTRRRARLGCLQAFHTLTEI